MNQAFGPLSGAVEHPAGASPRKCIIIIIENSGTLAYAPENERPMLIGVKEAFSE
jgi:hypothetical protein